MKSRSASLRNYVHTKCHCRVMGQDKLNSLKRLSRQVNTTRVAIAWYLLWYLLFSHFHPLPLVDEMDHQQVISGILRGNADLSRLPMLPGYHWLIAICSAIPGASLGFSRFLTFLISTMTILLYVSIPRQQDGRTSKRSPLLLAFLPILFPYTAMVYTDAVALFFLVGAIWAQTRRHYVLSGISAMVACLVRQSNMLWVIFIIAWSALEMSHLWKDRSDVLKLSMWNAVGRRLLPQIAAHLVVLVCMGTILILYGGVLASSVPGNRPRPNIGNFYSLSFFSLTLWAPIWLSRFRKDIRSSLRSMRLKPVKVGIFLVGLTFCGIILIATYDNWHPWNQKHWFLRNIPLIAMDRWIWFRFIGVICLFLAVWLITKFWSSQPNRRHLILLAAFTFLFLLPHSLVESRYLIVPFVLADFFLSYTKAQEVFLTVWYFSISLVVGILFVSSLAFW